MKMPLLRRIGIGLLVVTVLTWTGWTIWERTRTWCPVDVPVAVGQGIRTETKEFKVNLAGPYDIAVDATADRSIPLKDVACLLGTEPPWPERTCSKEPVLRASWNVTSHGQTIAEGVSGSERRGWLGSSQAARIVGTFNAQTGQTFKVSVKMLEDAAILSATNPRLKVSRGGTDFESALVFTGLLKVASIVLGMIGTVLIFVSFWSPKPHL